MTDESTNGLNLIRQLADQGYLFSHSYHLDGMVEQTVHYWVKGESTIGIARVLALDPKANPALRVRQLSWYTWVV